MRPQTPHALTARRTEVLLHLLRHDQPGRVPVCALPDGDHADDEWGWTPDGEPEGDLFVWVEGGRLAGIEHAVVADEHPDELPLVDLVIAPSR